MTCDIVIYTTQATHQRYWLGLFSDGLKAHDVKHKTVLVNGTHHEADIAIFWGIRPQHLIQQCQDYLVLERGYFGDRSKFTAIGWNGLNGRADFRNELSPSTRWDMYGMEMNPWNPVGDYVLLVGQVDGDMSINHLSIQRWYADAVADIRRVTDLPIKFRPHPLSNMVSHPANTQLSNPREPLEAVLSRAAFVVTCNSNVGVDAVLAGKPTIAYDAGSMVKSVAASCVGSLTLDEPDRMQWAYDIAYAQWTEHEIANGEAWEHICH